MGENNPKDLFNRTQTFKSVNDIIDEIICLLYIGQLNDYDIFEAI